MIFKAHDSSLSMCISSLPCVYQSSDPIAMSLASLPLTHSVSGVNTTVFTVVDTVLVSQESNVWRASVKKSLFGKNNAGA